MVNHRFIFSRAIEACIEDIRKWMFENRLVLNESKTEVIHFHSKFRKFNRLNSLNIGGTVVESVNSVRDLGFYFDDVLDFKVHIGHICKSVSYSLYRIGRIRNILDRTTTERLIHAFVTSRLDYCNSMLHNLPLTHRLQLLQNSAARLVTRTKKYDHITPVLYDLHWLPVHQRIKFKILLFTYKILHDQAPSYLCDLLTPSNPGRSLRSCVAVRFVEPRYRNESHGGRAFSVTAPRLWNALPPTVRNQTTLASFKTCLKTHLFNEHYKNF